MLLLCDNKLMQRVSLVRPATVSHGMLGVQAGAMCLCHGTWPVTFFVDYKRLHYTLCRSQGTARHDRWPSCCVGSGGVRCATMQHGTECGTAHCVSKPGPSPWQLVQADGTWAHKSLGAAGPQLRGGGEAGDPGAVHCPPVLVLSRDPEPTSAQTRGTQDWSRPSGARRFPPPSLFKGV